MGEYADDAVDRDLNSMFDYDYEELESGNGDTWYGIFRVPRPFRRRALKKEQRTNEVVFSNFIDKPIDYSQF